MKKFFKIIIVCVFVMPCFCSCAKEKIIDRKTLENVLFEMHLADAVISENGNATTDTAFYYQKIFDKYKCTRGDFEKSIRSYSIKTKGGLAAIYKNVETRFMKMRNGFNSKLFDFTPITNKLNFNFVKNISFDSITQSKDIQHFYDGIKKVSKPFGIKLPPRDSTIFADKKPIKDTVSVKDKTLKKKEIKEEKKVEQFESIQL